MAHEDNPLMYGGSSDWKNVVTTVSVKCKGCGTVHPGRFMCEIDTETGLCVSCVRRVKTIRTEEKNSVGGDNGR